MELAIVDSDTLSELARGHHSVTKRAEAYLEEHGRLTISAITLFERLRGYRAAISAGRPFHVQMRDFEAFVRTCVVLAVDEQVADVAATLWSKVGKKKRRAIGDLLIAATANVHGCSLITRNQRDFRAIAAAGGIELMLVDWSRPIRA
jgi:predicted nucleic acid-binding protein